MGPAPMIRIDLMSVRLGIGLRSILVIPGRPQAGPGIHKELQSCVWIPGSRASLTPRNDRHIKKGRAFARPSPLAPGMPRAVGSLDQNRGAGKGAAPALNNFPV